jgi:hypothetical protein
MSQITKSRIENVKFNLGRASGDVDNALAYARGVGDKELVTKVEKVEASIKEVVEHIKSKTGANG